MADRGDEGNRFLRPVENQPRNMVPADNNMATLEAEQRDDETIDLIVLWNAVRKRKWLVLSIVLIALGVGFLQTFLTVPVYRATATIQISPPTSNLLSIQDFEALPRSIAAMDLYRETQFDILRGRQLAENVVRRTGVYDNPELAGEIRQRSLTGEIRALPHRLRRALSSQPEQTMVEVDPELALERAIRRAGGALRGRINVAPRPNSQLVNISVSSFDPRFAAQMANAVVEEYIRSNMQRRYDAGQEAREFLEDQLNEMRISLERADQALADFAEDNRVADLSQRLEMARTTLRNLNSRQSEANANLVQLRAFREMIDNGRGAEIRAVREDGEIANLRRELNELNSQYASLSQRYQPGFPELVELETRRNEMRQQMAARERAILANVRSEYENISAEVASLETAIQEQEGAILALNQRGVQFNILRREFETNQELYNGMLQRLREIGIASGIQENNIAMIEPAMTAGRPVLPNPQRNISMALALGLAVAVGLALMLEFLDTTIRRVEDVERTANRPVIGLVPAVKASRKRGESLMARRRAERAVSHYSEIHPKSSVSEAFRSLRTSLMFSTPEGMPKTLLVTSPGPGDGKTTNAINLATVMAQNGAKVLLIDADLRKPRLHRDFGIPMAPGLTNRIAGVSSKNSTSSIVATTVNGLFIMPAGNQAPNPAELLSSERMRKLVGLAARTFDHVIIDSAPILGLADALILSRMVDGVIMVTASGKTTKTSFRTSVRRMNQVHAPLLGVVLNRVDMESPDYAYYSSYYYNYYSDPDQDAPALEDQAGKAAGSTAR